MRAKFMQAFATGAERNRPKLRALIFGAVTTIVCSYTSFAMAAYQVTVCVGEYANNCPTTYNFWYGCGTSPASAARNACGGAAYNYVHYLSRGGNQCGYEIYIVQCG